MLIAWLSRSVWRTSVRAASTAAILWCGIVLEARAQAPSQVNIPLQLMAVSGSYYRLAIDVGINGGTPQLYMFDTGSAPFAAAFNPNTWGGFSGQTRVPDSPYPHGNNVFYCYGGGVACSTGNIIGNRLQIQSLSFAGGVTLTANPGYAVEAISQLNFGSTSYSFPSYFNDPTARPPFSDLFGPFYGVFGAGNFTQGTLGGVLGQTIVSGLTQGYMVAANGQANPASSVNPPQQTDGINVSVGGHTQAVTTCSPCVTVGLTPQILGQFAPVGTPGTTGRTGVISVPSSSDSFNNPYVPYGTAPGNNGSTQYGATFTIGLAAPGTSTPAVSSTGGTLLDTGTPSNYLSKTLNVPAVATNGQVIAGVTLTATAVTGNGSNTPIPGMTTSTSVMTNGGRPNTYDASFASNSQSILGIGFFLQNSVLYDLSDNVIAYTPYFVTDANLVTTAGGPLIVESTNVPLGLAGVISGPGGVQIGNGGDVQLSATNTYTGATQIASGGRLLVSGPGSIAASSGVTNDGTFDISRAWAPISIAALTGAGTTYLGANTLVLTNASGTFSGSIADGGSYPVGGGSLTIAGGTQGLSGANSYSGATTVQAGAQLNLLGTGNIVSSSGLANNGTFDI
ncbi:autotransporter-associated beta strand repeat-containing protein, partial [Enhydrobacter aerosaccus]